MIRREAQYVKAEVGVDEAGAILGPIRQRRGIHAAWRTARRLLELRIAGERRFVAAEDAARYRDEISQVRSATGTSPKA